MSPNTESTEDYRVRVSEATAFTIARKGPEPKHDESIQAMAAGFIAGVSSLIALAIAGVSSERGDYAVITVALGAAATTYFYRRHQIRSWYEALQQRLIDTQPKD